jgi:hypothetical protein
LISPTLKDYLPMNFIFSSFSAIPMRSILSFSVSDELFSAYTKIDNLILSTRRQTIEKRVESAVKSKYGEFICKEEQISRDKDSRDSALNALMGMKELIVDQIDIEYEGSTGFAGACTAGIRCASTLVRSESINHPH